MTLQTEGDRCLLGTLGTIGSPHRHQPHESGNSEDESTHIMNQVGITAPSQDQDQDQDYDGSRMVPLRVIGAGGPDRTD